MSDQTKALTNLHPDILHFQNDIRSKYAAPNQTAKEGQIVFIGSSLMEILPID